MPYDFKKEYRHIRGPEIITVPAVNYISVRGKGNPNEDGGEYQTAIRILYAVSYTLKMCRKMDYIINGYYDYVVPPLEGFWEWNTGCKDKSSMKWLAVMRLPEFVTEENFNWAVVTASSRKKLDCSAANFMTVNEGQCVQALHNGAFDDEPLTIALMDEFIHKHGLMNDITENRLHHEIYLSDPRRTAPEKLKTVIRHPIKKV